MTTIVNMEIARQYAGQLDGLTVEPGIYPNSVTATYGNATIPAIVEGGGIKVLVSMSVGGHTRRQKIDLKQFIYSPLHPAWGML